MAVLGMLGLCPTHLQHKIHIQKQNAHGQKSPKRLAFAITASVFIGKQTQAKQQRKDIDA